MPVNSHGLPIKRKGPARLRQERRERYLDNHELNKSIQRNYARDRARHARELKLPLPREDLDWASLSVHARAVILALWAGLDTAARNIHCPGLPNDVDSRHGSHLTFSHLYNVYETLAGSSNIVPLDRGDVRTLIDKLERNRWLIRTWFGVLPDGASGVSSQRLIVSLVKADDIEGRLLRVDEPHSSLMRCIVQWFREQL